MLGRKVNGIMPVENNKLVKNNYKQIKEALKNKQNNQKYYYDKITYTL